ncbi:MAG: hypothetical protein GXP53_04920 [Deltaproteobacteria bacterium]|nr:hypothetical protein [Deltaproteobacteria bacterium]
MDINNEFINLDGVVKSPIYCVVAGREILGILYVCLRFRDTNYALYMELST